MLTLKTKYALRALIYLAGNKGSPVLIAKIAKDERMPKKFLERILLEMNREGILTSKKGKGGGYLLGRPPSEISIGEVVRIMDGPLAPVSCVSATAYAPCKDCPSESLCAIKPVMKKVRNAIAGIMDTTTLEDMIRLGPGSESWAYVI